MRRRNITKQGRAATIVTTLRLRKETGWRTYEDGKRELQKLNLPADQYEKAIQQLTRAIKV